jgi:hypothetical protein
VVENDLDFLSDEKDHPTDTQNETPSENKTDD